MGICDVRNNIDSGTWSALEEYHNAAADEPFFEVWGALVAHARTSRRQLGLSILDMISAQIKEDIQ